MDFLKSKFDNISLVIVLCLVGGMVIHFVHDQDGAAAISWAQQTFTTVLGAYLLLTQGHRLPFAQNKQNGNGSSPSGDSPIAMPIVADQATPAAAPRTDLGGIQDRSSR